MPSCLHRIAFAALLAATPALRAAGPVAYASPVSSYLTAFNPASGNIQKVANLGFFPFNPRIFVLSPDGKTAYVGGNYISVLSLPSGKLIKTITALPDPDALALNSDGSLLYGLNSLGLALFVIDTSSGTLVTVAKLNTSYASEIVVAPDDSNIYLTGLYGVTVVNAHTYAVAGMIRIQGEYGEVISNDGKTLYVASQNAPYLVYVVDTATITIRATIPAGTAGPATSIALSPDDKTLYVQANKVLVEIATADETVIGTIGTPEGFVSSQLAVSLDGKSAFECGTLFPGLLQFDLAAGTLKPIPLGGSAASLRVSPASGAVYIVQTFSNVLTEDPSTDRVLQSVGPVRATHQLTLSGNGNTIGGVAFTYLPAAEVSLIDTATHTSKNVTVPTDTVLDPPSLALNRDASLAFVPTAISPLQIAVIDTGNGTLQRTITVPGIPISLGGAVAIAPDDSTLYAFGYNGTGNLCSISLSQFTQTKCVSTPPGFNGTRALAVSADGLKLYLLVSFVQPISASGLLEYDSSSLAITRHVSLGLPANFFENSLVYSAASNSVYIASDNYANQANPVGTLTRIDLGSFSIAATQPLAYAPADVGVAPDGTKIVVAGSVSGTDVFDGVSLAPAGSIAGGQEQSVVLASR